MLVLGHVGFALGAAALVSRFLPEAPRTSPHPASAEEGYQGPARADRLLGRLAERVDIRLPLIGSMLPDILDKPLGHFLFRESLGNGRIFSHTLLFLLVATLAGLLVRRRMGVALLGLSLGVLTHLIGDQIWLLPETLFWPLLGPFPQVVFDDWLGNVWYALLHDPFLYITEAVGGVALALFSWRLARRRSLGGFITKGRLTNP